MSLGPRPGCCYNGKFAETYFFDKQMLRKSTNKNIGLQICLFDISLQINKQAEVNPGYLLEDYFTMEDKIFGKIEIFSLQS